MPRRRRNSGRGVQYTGESSSKHFTVITKEEVQRNLDRIAREARDKQWAAHEARMAAHYKFPTGAGARDDFMRAGLLFGFRRETRSVAGTPEAQAMREQFKPSLPLDKRGRRRLFP